MPLSKKRIKEIEAIPDSKIDFSDIPETDAAFWANAKLIPPKKKHKQERVNLRLDPTVLDWFRKTGRGYEARMNAVLRYYVEACTALRTK